MDRYEVNEIYRQFQRKARYFVINEERKEVIAVFSLLINCWAFFNQLPNQDVFIIWDDDKQEEVLNKN